MDRMNRKDNNRSDRAAFLTLGCKVNAYETDAMEKLFREAGYTIVGFEEEADVYIINTCTVTNIADRKSRQMLHRARIKNKDAVIAAAGCYVQADSEKVKQDTAVDVMIGNNQKHKAVEMVDAYRKDKKLSCKVEDIRKDKEFEALSIDTTGEKTRAYIKIQDGCSQFCSYCIIPYTRGRVRSRELSDIIKEVEYLASKGYKEVILTGIHLSSYGVDLPIWRQGGKEQNFTALGGMPLLNVIKEISRIDGIKRIRLGSIEPRIITEEFAKQLSMFSKVCPHFHLSLQSGCDATLRRMNRHYTTKEYLQSVSIVRNYFKNPAVTTDVIVGFPGETMEEFNQTEDFIKEVHFFDVHVFKFSPRRGTRAYDMENQVPGQEKMKRSERLLALTKQLNEQYRRTFLNKKMTLLLEEELILDGKRYLTGHNERYVKAVVPCCEQKENSVKSNQMIDVTAWKELENGMLLCSTQDMGIC